MVSAAGARTDNLEIEIGQTTKQSTMSQQLTIQPIFDNDSHTITYVVSDPVTKKSAVIDSVLDYNHKMSKQTLYWPTKSLPI